MDTTPLTAVIATLIAVLTAMVNEVRRGAWLPRFVYDREATARDLSDQRGDRLETAVEALSRAVVDQGQASAAKIERLDTEIVALKDVIVALRAEVVSLKAAVRHDVSGKRT